jgi:hypothetical protein
VRRSAGSGEASRDVPSLRGLTGGARSVRSRSSSCTPLVTKNGEEHKVKTISREELKAKINWGDNFVLLEVLREESYRRAHLPGAIRFQDTNRAPELLPDKSATIVAYCSNFN